jgi:hypothetical protein
MGWVAFALSSCFISTASKRGEFCTRPGKSPHYSVPSTPASFKDRDRTTHQTSTPAIHSDDSAACMSAKVGRMSQPGRTQISTNLTGATSTLERSRAFHATWQQHEQAYEHEKPTNLPPDFRRGALSADIGTILRVPPEVFIQAIAGESCHACMELYSQSSLQANESHACIFCASVASSSGQCFSQLAQGRCDR